MCVFLSNPFSVPVAFSNIQPVFSTLCGEFDSVDVLYELFDQPVILPPNTAEFKLSLKVKPLSRGMIFLQGLKFIMNKAEDIVIFDENGCFCDNPLAMPWSYDNAHIKRHIAGHQSRIVSRNMRFVRAFPLNVRVIGPRLQYWPTVVPSLPLIFEASAIKNDGHHFNINFGTKVTGIGQTQNLTITWTIGSDHTETSKVESWRLIATQNINEIETKLVLVNFSSPLIPVCSSNVPTKSSVVFYCSLLEFSIKENRTDRTQDFCCVVALTIAEGLRSFQFDFDVVGLDDLQHYSAMYESNWKQQNILTMEKISNVQISLNGPPCDPLYFQRTSLLIRMNKPPW